MLDGSTVLKLEVIWIIAERDRLVQDLGRIVFDKDEGCDICLICKNLFI